MTPRAGACYKKHVSFNTRSADARLETLRSKPPSYFAAIVGLVLLAVFSGLFFNSRERALRSDAEKKLGEVIQRNSELENELSRAIQEKTQIETRLQDAEDRLLALSDKLVTVSDQLSRMKQHRHRTWMSYRTMVLRRRALELELKQKDEQVRRILADMDDLMRDRTVDLGAVIVPHDGEAVPLRNGTASANARKARTKDSAALPVGKVVVVNEASEFVVVDLGEGQGIRKGTELLITRNGDLIGGGQIEMVQGALSAATVSRASANKMRVGDTVRVMEI